MKLLICGDRNWIDENAILDFFNYFQKTYHIELVIEGGANGADKLAGSVASSLGIPVLEIKPEVYGKGAGHIRNQKLLDEKPNLVVAFHDNIGESKGTANCLTQAEDREIIYILISSNLCRVV